MVFAVCYWRGWWLPRSTDPYVLWLLPAPMVLEWSAGMFGSAYRRGRQVAATALGAVPSGIAVAVHVHEPFAARVAWPVTTYVVLGFAVAGWCALRRRPTRSDWEATFEETETVRAAALRDLLPEFGHEIDESLHGTHERGVKVTK